MSALLGPRNVVSKVAIVCDDDQPGGTYNFSHLPADTPVRGLLGSRVSRRNEQQIDSQRIQDFFEVLGADRQVTHSHNATRSIFFLELLDEAGNFIDRHGYVF